MSSEFAHRHGLESIWTLRLNDIHDAWTPQFVPKWKRDDPSRVISTLEKSRGYRDRRRLWSLVDFEHPDAAPRLLAIIEEVLRNYPVDELVALGHKHNVPVHPCLSQSGLMCCRPRGTNTPEPPAAWFGAAMRYSRQERQAVRCWTCHYANDSCHELICEGLKATNPGLRTSRMNVLRQVPRAGITTRREL